MTLQGIKRIAFRILLAAAAVISAWWILAVPYRPGAVLDAIPENAAWVSVHRNPGPRWAELSANGVVRAATAAAGLDLAAMQSGVTSPRDRVWLKRLTRREVALAYVPEMPGSGAPAWVISCWAGGYSQRMRWLLNLSGRKPVSGPWSDPAHPFWRLNAPGLPDGLQASLGIREGLAVLAISTDPLAVRACLVVAEGDPMAKSVRTAGAEARAQTLFRNAKCPDRGWMRLPGSAAEWVFEADEVTANRFQACARATTPAPKSLTAPLAGNPAPLAAFADEAEGAVLAPWPWLRGLLAPGAGNWLGSVDTLVRDAAGTDQVRVFAGMYGGEHAARIKSLFGGEIETFIQGLKMPAFVCAIPVSEEAKSQEAVARFLDRVNRVKPYGLVLRPAGICYGRAVTAVEGTREGMYKDFSQSEQAAFTVAEGWLVIASHLGALEGLIPAIPHGAKPGSEPARGLQMRIKGPAFSRTAGKFLAALSLVYMTQDSPDAGRARARTAEARRWIEALGAAGDVEVSAGADEAVLIRAQRAD